MPMPMPMPQNGSKDRLASVHPHPSHAFSTPTLKSGVNLPTLPARGLFLVPTYKTSGVQLSGWVHGY